MDIMNWKEHIIIGLLYSLPVIYAPEHLFLAIAGSLYPDLDHEVKEEIVKRALFISGSVILINILLYYLNKSLFNIEFFILAVLIFFIFLFPYFSEHRTYTHTFYALIFVSLILAYFQLKLSTISPTLASLLILCLVTSEKILGRIIFFAIVGWTILSIIGYKSSINLFSYFLPIFTGYLSHILADATTPKGIKPFYPLNYRLKKNEAILIGIVVFLVLSYLRFKSINL